MTSKEETQDLASQKKHNLASQKKHDLASQKKHILASQKKPSSFDRDESPPEALKALLRAAEKAVKAGNFDEAEVLANQVASSTSEKTGDEALPGLSALHLLANLEDRRGNHSRTINHLSTALRRSEKAGNKEEVAKALGKIGDVHVNLSDYRQALDSYSQALVIDQVVGNSQGVARHFGNIANVHMHLSDYTQSLEYNNRALSLDRELGNKSGISRWLANIGLVYSYLSDYSRALDYYNESLSIDEELGNRAGVAAGVGNIGIVYAHLSDYTKALDYFGRALATFEELGHKAGMAIWLGNIGNVYSMSSDYARALDYFGKALSIDEEIGHKAGVATWLGNMGRVHVELAEYAKGLEYFLRSVSLLENLGLKSFASDFKANIGALYAIVEWTGCDDAKAEKYLLESIAVSRELGTKNYVPHQSLAKLYKRQGRLEEAMAQLEIFYESKGEVQNEEARKKSHQMEQQKQAAEREKEITIAKAIASAKLSATTSLLHKVLPETIATRMIEGEQDIADYFPAVSILFVDIAGFTPLSARMPASIVVRFLNHVFREFDHIIKKHGCEKIKTIGDGYMAVAGAPIECADHAERMAAAALEMQQTISLPDDVREHLPPGTKFGVRIGLHTGSVIAGVIGDERFVYDIYSDAVNTAARMESHGEPNKIHCSNDFYRHLQHRFSSEENTTHGLVFEKRGEMEIKGKGMMHTYFLEKE